MRVEDAEEALGEEAIGGAAHRVGGGAAEQRLGRAIERITRCAASTHMMAMGRR